jgi:hypothetical protein
MAGLMAAGGASFIAAVLMSRVIAGHAVFSNAIWFVIALSSSGMAGNESKCSSISFAATQQNCGFHLN